MPSDVSFGGDKFGRIVAWRLGSRRLDLLACVGVAQGCNCRDSIYFSAGAHGSLGCAIAWMGSVCIMNSRRCGRVHCRFTGPKKLTFGHSLTGCFDGFWIVKYEPVVY